MVDHGDYADYSDAFIVCARNYGTLMTPEVGMYWRGQVVFPGPMKHCLTVFN
jgi:hypothetical protein